MKDVDDNADKDNGYTIVRSSSPVLASASNKLSTWVSMKMDMGWSPLGAPVLHFDGNKFNIIQAMIK